jgi:hypothetical protein
MTCILVNYLALLRFGIQPLWLLHDIAIMSLPPAPYDPRRIFMFKLPKFNVGSKGREIGTYVAGGLVSCLTSGIIVSSRGLLRDSPDLLSSQFAASYFLLIDAATLSSHAKPPPDAPHDVIPVHMSFVDWIPAIFSTRKSELYPLYLAMLSRPIAF